ARRAVSGAARGSTALAPAPAAGPLPYPAGDAASANGRSPLAVWVGTNGVNFTPGRRGPQPPAIGHHTMMGTLAETSPTFQTRHAPGKGASANYGIGQNGQIVQFVDDNDTAWANGPIFNPNLDVVPWIAQVHEQGWDPNTLTLSIEWEGSHGDG